MTADRHTFSPLQRALHWLMALVVLAMLFIGVTMVSTLGPRFLTLTAIRKTLGIAILVLAFLRLGIRFKRGAPLLPPDLPSYTRSAPNSCTSCFMCS